MLDALLFAKTPALFRILYKDCTWKVDTTEKKIFLTFDDGPIPGVTPFVLDQLKKHQAKATFFCIGKNIKANPAIYKRIIKEGHRIGNHTFDHFNGWNHINKNYYTNIDKCSRVLNGLKTPKNKDGKLLFRPPYGKLKPSQYKALKSKLNIVMWDVLTFDFDTQKTKEQVLKTALKYTEPGSIIVFHDSLKARPRLEYALPKVLEHFSAKGYKFDRL
ncbi:MAG TPA: polysaccharide deacetylase family protein [Chitinophagales bacterium]|nr:polysaccharide deacetylase family protein [Chitinophagales bacterium]